MKDKVAFSVQLEQTKIDWLEEVANRYDLPDRGKALRCLIDHARENPSMQDAIFSEIHCVDCAG